MLFLVVFVFIFALMYSFLCRRGKRDDAGQCLFPFFCVSNADNIIYNYGVVFSGFFLWLLWFRFFFFLPFAFFSLQSFQLLGLYSLLCFHLTWCCAFSPLVSFFFLFLVAAYVLVFFFFPEILLGWHEQDLWQIPCKGSKRRRVSRDVCAHNHIERKEGQLQVNHDAVHAGSEHGEDERRHPSGVQSFVDSLTFSSFFSSSW